MSYPGEAGRVTEAGWRLQSFPTPEREDFPITNGQRFRYRGLGFGVRRAVPRGDDRRGADAHPTRPESTTEIQTLSASRVRPSAFHAMMGSSWER